MMQQICMQCSELLPYYLTSKIEDSEQVLVEQHLRACAECRQALAEWKQVKTVLAYENRSQVVQPFSPSWEFFRQRLKEQPDQQHSNMAGFLAWWEASYDLLLTQIRLLRAEFWVWQILTMVLAIILLLLNIPWQHRLEAMAWGSGMLAALSTVSIMGEEHNIEKELAPTTITAPAILLLNRLGILAGLQVILNVGAALGFHLLAHSISWSLFTAQWLAPLSFLIALVLLLSVLCRPAVALVVAIVLWTFRLITYLPTLNSWLALQQYEQFWQKNSLFILSILLITATFLYLQLRKRYA